MSTPAPSASEKNKAPGSNLAYDNNAPDSLALLYPNPGGIELSDDIWIVDIPGAYQDVYLLQDLTLADSLAANKISIEVSVYEDTETEGAQKYDFLDIENVIHNITSDEKAIYISPIISTDPIISYNVYVASII